MPARLHHERIARSSEVPIRWVAMTHGIYGAGANWRGIARKLVERRPELGVILVDLRQHGRSDPGEPPHTLAACADDVAALVTELGGVFALVGHSFGGKVMLATRARVTVEQTWILDASPSARPDALADPTNSVVQVLALLERSPKTWTKRDEFIAAVMADGHELGLAQWLAMNIVPDPSGALVLRLEPVALRTLLASYYATDLWAELRDPARGDIELVVADRSPVFVPGELGQVADAAHVHVHHVAAGHWLHIEAPGAVVDLLVGGLP